MLRGVDDRPHRRLVGRDEDRAAAATVRGAREIGGEPRQETRRHAGQRHRPVGGEDLLEVGQSIPRA
jgi:hypothetical protein